MIPLSEKPQLPAGNGKGAESHRPLRERLGVLKPWLRRGWKPAVVLLVVGVAVYWFVLSPVPVVQHQLERGEIIAEVMGTGTLEARVKATISPKIAGRIKEVLADQGDHVPAGKVLVRLDDEELTQQVEIARANLAAAKAALDRLKSDKDRALAVFSQAKQNHSRVQRLVNTAAASREDMDKAAESLSVAEAGVSHAEAASIEGQKNLIAAERTLEYHRARQADTTLAAPFDGLIVRRQRDPGDVAVPGSPVLTLISTQEIWVGAWVDETELAKVQAGQSARVVFRSEPDRVYPGRVARLGRETDRETREFVVEVRVLELPTNWTVGQRAEAYIETARKSDVTLLPANYVVWRGRRAGVFVNASGRAVWRFVRVGLRSQDQIEVLEGLDAGETVVAPSDPRTTLTEGRRIFLK